MFRIMKIYSYFQLNLKFSFLLFLILFYFQTNKLYSQNSFSLGIKSNYSSSNINFHNNFFPSNIKTNTLESYGLSFISEIQNDKNIGLRIEFSKATKGWNQEFLDGQFYKSKTTYINFPILMNAYLGKSNTKVLFSLGPFFDFLLNHTKEFNLLLENQESIFNADYSSTRDNKFGYGLMLSGGISLDINRNKIQLLSSFQYNLDNLIDVVEKSIDLPDISNFNTFTISLSYLFKIKN